jgi:hypothetical protein
MSSFVQGLRTGVFLAAWLSSLEVLRYGLATAPLDGEKEVVTKLVPTTCPASLMPAASPNPKSMVLPPLHSRASVELVAKLVPTTCPASLMAEALVDG